MAIEHRLAGALAIGGFLLTVGCATATVVPQVHVDVSALRDPQAPEKRAYVLYPGQKGLEPTDLQFKEVAE